MPPWVLALGKLVEPYWAIVLFIAVPVAGVVGFLANLASLKKTRLENRRLADELARMPKTAEKLELELSAMKRASREAEEREQKGKEEEKKAARLVKPADEAEMRRLLYEKALFEREVHPKAADDSRDYVPSRRSPMSIRWLIMIILATVFLTLYTVAHHFGLFH